jgi:hypothetical protein
MDPNVSLRVDQIADLSVYIRDRKVLNLSDPGTGKTPSVCVMQWFRWNEESKGTIWVMPKSLLRKNKRELHRFTEFTNEQVQIVDGTKTKVEKILATKAPVLLMGPRRFNLIHKQLDKMYKAIDVDEFHMCFKSADSQQTQALFYCFDVLGFTDFIPMTGSIINGRLDSAYPAIHVVEPRYYDSHDQFRYYHGIFDYDNKLIGWGNHNKLSQIFGRHGIRRTFAEVHGEQEVVFLPEMAKMGVRQREMYDEFHDEAILELDRFYLDGTEPGVAFIRARQLMEHPNYFPDLSDPGKFVDIMDGDIPTKEQLLEVHLEHHAATNKPLIIFSSMRPQQVRIEQMLKDFGFAYGVINGDTSDKERDRIDTAFQAGRITVILCSPPCAGVGYNWQFCGEQEVDHVIFMTVGYLDTEISQAYKRAIRGKRNSPLLVTILEYEDSMDQHLLGIVYRKSMDAHKVDPTYKVLQLSGFEKDYSIKEPCAA